MIRPKDDPYWKEVTKKNRQRPWRVKVLMAWALVAVLVAPFILFGVNTEPVTVHVFVALCDNDHQGIVPVSETLGNGDDPESNLYWGAMYGVKTFFKNSARWKLMKTIDPPKDAVLERCVFKHRDGKAYLVADAYRGREIKQAVVDFLEAAAGNNKETVKIRVGTETIKLSVGGSSGLVAYVGHDGLMDFRLTSFPKGKKSGREAIILACASKQYFSDAIKASGADPLLWTTGLMAPEAYTLEAAVEGWINHETDEQVLNRAAAAYNNYQKCGIKAAKSLLVTGW